MAAHKVQNPDPEEIEYWTTRAERVIIAGEKDALQLSEELAALYESATRTMQRRIEAFYGRYAKESGLTLEDVRKLLSPSELKSFKREAAQYYHELKLLKGDPAFRAQLKKQSARAYMSRLNELQINMQYEVEKLYAKEHILFADKLSKTYENSYLRTGYDIQNAFRNYGGFTSLNTAAIERAVATKWLGDNFSDRIWADKDKLVIELQRIIPQGIALGQNPRVIGRNLAKAMETRKSYGVRLARTEFNHIANEATFAGYKICGVEQYQVLATLDHRTSDICAHMDGHIFKLSEKQEGVTYPPFHPHCRSTTIPHFEPDEIDAQFGTDTPMSFKEWKENLQKNS